MRFDTTLENRWWWWNKGFYVIVYIATETILGGKTLLTQTQSNFQEELTNRIDELSKDQPGEELVIGLARTLHHQLNSSHPSRFAKNALPYQSELEVLMRVVVGILDAGNEGRCGDIRGDYISEKLRSATRSLSLELEKRVPSFRQAEIRHAIRLGSID
jgi:hypothetical protein